MFYIILSGLIALLIGAIIVLFLKNVELVKAEALQYENSCTWYDKWVDANRELNELREKDSVKAYEALEQGMTETQDAYATDMAQYEDSLQTIHEAMQVELTETYLAIRRKVEEDKRIADLQKFVDANNQS